jgi:hypothetical protein
MKTFERISGSVARKVGDKIAVNVSKGLKMVGTEEKTIVGIPTFIRDINEADACIYQTTGKISFDRIVVG